MAEDNWNIDELIESLPEERFGLDRSENADGEVESGSQRSNEGRLGIPVNSNTASMARNTIPAGDANPNSKASTGKLSSAFTESFFSARSTSSAINFKPGSSAPYGTSCPTSSPLSRGSAGSSSYAFKPRTERALQSEYAALLERKGLLQDPKTEFNWTGRKPGLGQHVEFALNETVPLEVQGLIFQSHKAKIDRVKCRRIVLARKSMSCSRRLKLADALNEVEHLQKLRHAHILQLVGSYLQGKTFAILLYPVADCHLQDFIHRIETSLAARRLDDETFLAVASLGSFFRCLAAGIEYIHTNTLKHLDIKPQNVLVRMKTGNLFGYHVYISDFGFSRSFSPVDHSQTDSIIPRTPKYCAPEVYHDEKKGRSADIFSLGCVFLEMHTVLCRRTIDDFEDFRAGSTDDTSFHGNVDRVADWCNSLRELKPVFVVDPVVLDGHPTNEHKLPKHSLIARHHRLCTIIASMLQENPTHRPDAGTLVRHLWPQEYEYFGTCCCADDPEKFEDAAANTIRPNFARTHLASFPARYLSRAQCRHVLRHALETGEKKLTSQILLSFYGSWTVWTNGIKLKPRMLTVLCLLAWDEEDDVLQTFFSEYPDMDKQMTMENFLLRIAVLKGRLRAVRRILESGIRPADIDLLNALARANRSSLILRASDAKAAQEPKGYLYSDASHDNRILFAIVHAGPDILARQIFSTTLARDGLDHEYAIPNEVQEAMDARLRDQIYKEREWFLAGRHSVLGLCVLLQATPGCFSVRDFEKQNVLQSLLETRLPEDKILKARIDEEDLLGMAIRTQNIEGAQLLLDYGADPNRTGVLPPFQSPLPAIISQANRFAKRAILTPSYMNSLSEADRTKHISLARSLIRKGARLDLREKSGKLPIDYLHVPYALGGQKWMELLSGTAPTPL